MIDERQQELASLYAFDLLEGAERTQFEASLERDPKLQQLVAELREAAAGLAHAAPRTEPPAVLKQRILASIDERAGTAEEDDSNVVAFPRAGLLGRILPWAIAAGFAISTAWLSERYFVTRQEGELLADRAALAEIALKSARVQLDSEHIVSQRVAAEYNTFKANADRLLADAQAARKALEEKIGTGVATTRELEQQLAELRQREADAKSQVLALQDQLKRDSDLARLKIATLASMLNNSPQAVAVAVWDPGQQKGVFAVDQLPAIGADQSYELWVIDQKPVSAGVFTVGADGRAHVQFRPTERIQTAAKFAVSREKRDGAKSHATPGEVIMISQ